MDNYKTNVSDDNKHCQIVEVNGSHLLLMPDGEVVPNVTLTSVHQGMPEITASYKGAHAKVELFVILSSVIEELPDISTNDKSTVIP